MYVEVSEMSIAPAVKFALDARHARNYIARMKNEKRTTIRISESSDRKVDIIKGLLLANHGQNYSRDDVIDRIIEESDQKAVIKVMSGSGK